MLRKIIKLKITKSIDSVVKSNKQVKVSNNLMIIKLERNLYILYWSHATIGSSEDNYTHTSHMFRFQTPDRSKK